MIDRCPNPAGVEPLGPGAKAGAQRALHELKGSPSHSRRYADPAWWPQLQFRLNPFAVSTQHGPAPHWGMVESRPAGQFLVAHHNCGPWLLRHSWAVTLGPTAGPDRNSASLPTTYYFLQRNGHWLLWFVY